MAVIWSEIPEELVYMFVERLVCVDDLIRFGSVCKVWRSVSISEKQKKKVYSPLMMLPNAENDNEEGMRSLVIPCYIDGDGGANLYKKTRSLEIELPKAQGRRCWGSPYGWVVTVGGRDLDTGLLNPLTGAHLPLPPQPTLEDQYHLEPYRVIYEYIHKYALFWHPSSQCWLVMAITGIDEEVIFTFTGIGKQPSSWTTIDDTVDAEDVIFFQGRIYLIGGDLKVCDLKEGTPPKPVHIAWPPEHVVDDLDSFYLVEIAGNLNLVARYFDPGKTEHSVTTNFIVWRFNFSSTEWYKLDDLGEYALFLGNNTSFAISTLTYSEFSRNCVYFTDDPYDAYNNQFCDMGVYDYGERTIEPFYIADMGAFSKFSLPTLFMPTL